MLFTRGTRRQWTARISWWVRFGALLGCLAGLTACQEERKPRKVVAPYNGPIEEINNVNMLYSEAALLKVRMTTASQLRYVSEDRTYPKPVNIEFYGPAGDVVTTLRSDSGRYSKAKDIYTLMGHVVVVKKLTREKLLTEELNWNPNTKKVYTEQRVTVLNQLTGEKLYGMGMIAEQDFSRYSFKKVSGVFGVEGGPGF